MEQNYNLTLQMVVKIPLFRDFRYFWLLESSRPCNWRVLILLDRFAEKVTLVFMGTFQSFLQFFTIALIDCQSGGNKFSLVGFIVYLSFFPKVFPRIRLGVLRIKFYNHKWNEIIKPSSLSAERGKLLFRGWGFL